MSIPISLALFMLFTTINNYFVFGDTKKSTNQVEYFLAPLGPEWIVLYHKQCLRLADGDTTLSVSFGSKFSFNRRASGSASLILPSIVATNKGNNRVIT
ncbi:hypothetical protein BDA99DRAFT_561280 [Phascolomyces articulosus]|uniref:Uncharacterized protein n=1 Tax=Phascolomyces articulosus TaxID=60185 RepID=A0AAD5K7G7_9FUNG|nr:hypothetical protein BDA99DRAFT_561280 [Phascolomyces articulosus]